MHPLPGKEQQSRSNFRKATLPILMAGDIVHDLFTVFTFKTLPSAGFVYTCDFSRPGKKSCQGKFAFNFACRQSYATFPKPNEESKAVAVRVHICDFNPECNASDPGFSGARDACRSRAAGAGKTLSRLLLGRRWNQQPRSN